MDADDKKIIDEEAIAEEEFVADLEDTIENPLVYDGDKLTVQKKEEPVTDKKEGGLEGAIGTGGLAADPEPFNNENAYRSESVNNDENPFGADPNTEKAFGGPDAAPLDDASETIAPSTAPDTGGNPFGAEVNNNTPDVTDFSTTVDTTTSAAPEAATTASAPTIEQLANEAAGKPAETPAATTTPAATEPKKKKTGLIVGIIVGVLLIAAIIGGIVFYNIHESKERMLSDAVAGLYKADARQFDGKIVMTPDMGGADESLVQMFGSVKNLTLEFKGDNKSVNFNGSGSLTLNTTDDKSYSITLSGAYISNDGIFVMIDNLGDTVKKLDLESMLGGGGVNADYNKFVGAVLKDVISDAAGVLDGKWYKINADTFGENERAKEIYECYTKALDDLSSESTKNDMANIYTAHPFIVFDDKDSEKADGLTYFYVKADEDESKAFLKDVEDLSVYKNMNACISSSTSVSDNNSYRSAEAMDGDIARPEESKKKEDDIKANVKVGITGWTHELRAVKGGITAPNLNVDLDFKVNYEKKDVPAPASDAKDITEAYTDVEAKIKESLKPSYLKHGEELCKENTETEAEYKACYRELEDQIDRVYRQMDNDGGIIITSTSALLDENEDED